jgi:fumarate reductase flavoprotein subunit
MKKPKEVSKDMKIRGYSDAKSLESDVLVIGGGGTGLAAALAAVEHNARVTLLEKRAGTGGTSVFARGLCAVESHIQKEMGIGVTRDDIFKIAMDYSHWTINPQIMRAFLDKTADTICWLEKQGLRFGPITTMYPSMDAPVFHSLGPDTVAGAVITRVLRHHCEQMGVQMILNCAAKKLLVNNDRQIRGVLADLNGEAISLRARSVIIATGGYTGNKELLKKYYPAYSDNIAFLGIPHTGDGLIMANEIGAANEGLGALLLHPQYYRSAVRVDAIAQEPSTVWVNRNGNRFTDETTAFRPIEAGNAINRQPDKCSYVLLDQKLKNKIEEEGFLRGGVHGAHIPVGVKVTNLEPDLRVEADKGGVKISDSWDDIAQWIGATPAILKNTIEEYNQFYDQGYDAAYNKPHRYLQALRTPPYYAIRCYLSCLDTIGGIKINHHMEVLDKQDSPIPGLYAGGDVAGGWESDTYCILIPGTALGFAINSGRIAGENACKHACLSH